jgi:hypothetical protein
MRLRIPQQNCLRFVSLFDACAAHPKRQSPGSWTTNTQFPLQVQSSLLPASITRSRIAIFSDGTRHRPPHEPFLGGSVHEQPTRRPSRATQCPVWAHPRRASRSRHAARQPVPRWPVGCRYEVSHSVGRSPSTARVLRAVTDVLQHGGILSGSKSLTERNDIDCTHET